MSQPTDQVNSKKLFVGNLPYAVTEDELSQLFAEHGELVDVKLITDRMTGRSKGIAFVEYATEEQAQAAIEALHGYELHERALVVNVARPRAPRSNRGFQRGGRRGGFRGGRGSYQRSGRDQ